MAKCAQSIRICRVLRFFKRHFDVTLRSEIVNFVGLHLLDDLNQTTGVSEIAIVKHQSRCILMGVLIKVVNTVGIERRGAALDAVHLVAFAHQQFGKIGTNLSSNASDESFLQGLTFPVSVKLTMDIDHDIDHSTSLKGHDSARGIRDQFLHR
jgi:hypothetical protein